MEDGNPRRAVDILDAASQAFPNNLTVTKAVAGGYARVGRAKEALVIYRTIPMQDASAGDFEGADRRCPRRQREQGLIRGAAW